MNPVRALARPLLGSVFVSGGIDMLRNAPSLAPVAEPVTTPIVDAAQPVVDRAADAAAPIVEAAADKANDLAEQAADAVGAAEPLVEATERAADATRSSPPRVVLPTDPELLTTVNGAVMVVAGTLLAIGKLPRLSAAALAATLVPTTLAGHRFWEITDDDQRAVQQTHFMKNVGLLGGLALAAIDAEGRPGVAWRARHSARTARREARMARRIASGEARRRASLAADAVTDVLPG